MNQRKKFNQGTFVPRSMLSSPLSCCCPNKKRTEAITTNISIAVSLMARQRLCKKNPLCSFIDLSNVRITPIMALDA